MSSRCDWPYHRGGSLRNVWNVYKCECAHRRCGLILIIRLALRVCNHLVSKWHMLSWSLKSWGGGVSADQSPAVSLRLPRIGGDFTAWLGINCDLVLRPTIHSALILTHFLSFRSKWPQPRPRRANQKSTCRFLTMHPESGNNVTHYKQSIQKTYAQKRFTTANMI